MDLYLFQPKIETEDSITKNCETLINKLIEKQKKH